MTSLAKNYNRRKISFKKGKGSFLYSSNGKKYLDFVQGIAVNSLGHSNPYLNTALNKQAKKVWHVSNAFQIPEAEKLAKISDIHKASRELNNLHRLWKSELGPVFPKERESLWKRL